MDDPGLEARAATWRRERRQAAAVAATLVLDIPRVFLERDVTDALEWTRVRDAALLLLVMYKQQETEEFLRGPIMEAALEEMPKPVPIAGGAVTIQDFPIDVIEQETGRLFPGIVAEIRRGIWRPGRPVNRHRIDGEIARLLSKYEDIAGPVAIQGDRLAEKQRRISRRLVVKPVPDEESAPTAQQRISWLERVLRRERRRTRPARFPDKARVVQKVDEATRDVNEVLNLLGPPPQSQAGPVVIPPRKPVGVS